MSAPQPAVSWDDRPALKRARRAQLIKVCRAEGIKIDREDMPHQWYLNMLEQQGINLNAPHPALDWYSVSGKDEHGQMHTETYPVVPEHETARLNVDYASEIQKAAGKQLEEAQEHANEQGKMIEQLLQRISALESNSVPLDRLTPPQLKGVAKERGLDVAGLSTKAELLAILGE